MNWWKEGVVYQVYLKSFYDLNGDGIGDLKGLISKLDYLKRLGVDIIWLNPIYLSPNIDNGYDIADYQNISPEYGTIDDFKILLNELHKRDMKLIMDLVVNHTSDQHKWFSERKKEFYIWKKGIEINGQILPPNDWKSAFGGSAWEYDEIEEEFYLHLFAKEQPDLNWENKEMRDLIYKMMNWWFEIGIDGFRMDVINQISKVEGFPNGSENYFNAPRLHDYLKEMNKKSLSKYNCMTVGECHKITPEIALDIVHPDRNELNMIFHFDMLKLDKGITRWDSKKFELLELKEIVRKWYVLFEEGGWNSNFLTNHDIPRAISRLGNDKKYHKESAKLLALLNISLPGTPYIYQGEEIGMTNADFVSIEEYRDIDSINYYNEEIKFQDKNLILQKLAKKSRDNSRTPIQWNNSLNAGFSTGTPWIKVNENYKDVNVEKNILDENSIINYYREVLSYRKSNKELIYGNFIEFEKDNPSLFIFERTYKNETTLILLNFSEEIQELNKNLDSYKLILSNYNLVNNRLMPYEARLLKKY
ncbi:MAG: glycoside hydrolase family 13 protein [Cetobacterium sp.]